MTTFKTILILLFIILFQRTIGQTQLDTISVYDASHLIGQQVIVKAKVSTVFYAKNSNGKPTFLNLEKAFPDNPIAVIIFENNRKKLKIDAQQYIGKTIIVKGKMELYKDEEKPYENKPSININSKDQIKIINVK